MKITKNRKNLYTTIIFALIILWLLVSAFLFYRCQQTQNISQKLNQNFNTLTGGKINLSETDLQKIDAFFGTSATSTIGLNTSVNLKNPFSKTDSATTSTTTLKD